MTMNSADRQRTHRSRLVAKSQVRSQATDLPPLTDRDWMRDAPCRGMDAALFFPERGESTREAKATCATCNVSAECLDYAMRNQIKFGIWGGRSERERRTLRRAERERMTA